MLPASTICATVLLRDSSFVQEPLFWLVSAAAALLASACLLHYLVIGRPARRLLGEKLNLASAKATEFIRRQNGIKRHGQLSGDWQNNVKGASLERLRSVSDSLPELTALVAAYTIRVQAAEALASRAWFLRTRACRKAVALLEEAEFAAVTSPATAGQPERSWKGTLNELSRRIHALLDDCEERLESVETALQASSDARDKVDDLLEAIAAKMAALSERNICFVPAEGNLGFIKARRAEQLPDSAFADPVALKPLAESLAADASLLDKQLAKVLDRKGAMERQIHDMTLGATAGAQRLRAQTAFYAFPSPGGPDAPPQAHQLFKLDGEADPAPFIENAAEHLKLAVEGLLSGDFDTCNAEYARALDAANAALDLVREVPAAKVAAEELAAGLSRGRVNLADLHAEASQYLNLTKDGFASTSYRTCHDLVVQCGQVLEQIGPVLAEAETLYRAQSFLSARDLLVELSRKVDQCLKKLPSVKARYEELSETRAQARKALEKAQPHIRALKAKFELNRFCVSLERQGEITALLQAVDRAGDACPDWEELEALFVELPRKLRSFNAVVDNDRQRHQKASEKAEAAEAGLREATRLCGRDSSRRKARTLLEDASARMESVRTNLGIAGYAWDEIQTEAEQVCAICREAGKLSNYDQQKFDKAMELLSRARDRREQLGRFAQEELASDKIVQANRNLEEAELAFRDRRWEDVEKLAGAAATSYQGSLNSRGMS